MNLEGRQLFEKAAELEREGRAFMVCSIVETEGSTPRKGGTHMLVTSDGESYGTVGGGAVEHRALDYSLELLKDPGAADPRKKRCFSYGLQQDGDAEAVCGGRVTVAFWQPEKVLEGAEGFFKELCALYDRRRPGWLVIDCRGQITAKAYAHDAVPAEYGAYTGLKPQSADGIYTEPLIDAERAFLIGGGHVGQALSPVLHGTGFRVTVVDDREFILKDGLFPDAEEVICCGYETLSGRITVTEKDYVVVTTHGHKGDFDSLRAVIPMHPKYLGCIGSKKKAAYIRERLRESGFTEEEILSVRSPAGLSIGAETPQEIAVSIASEMIACRRMGDASKAGGPMSGSGRE